MNDPASGRDRLGGPALYNSVSKRSCPQLNGEAYAVASQVLVGGGGGRVGPSGAFAIFFELALLNRKRYLKDER